MGITNIINIYFKKLVKLRKVKLWSKVKNMMDYFNSFESHMDFEGQSKAEFVSRTIVVLFGVVGLVFAAILTVPPWPLFRNKPIHWQKARPDPELMERKGKRKNEKFYLFILFC